MTQRDGWTVARVRLNEAFAGLTWGAVALVLAICIFDTFRDSLLVLVEAKPAQWLRWFWRRLYPTALMAIVMHLAVMAALNRYRTADRRQYFAVAAAVVVPCALGVLFKLHVLGILYMKPRVTDWYYESAGGFYAWYFVRYAVLGLLFAAVYTMYRQEQQRMQVLQQTELDRSRLREQMAEARLQALAAQIEPHFLFNTLANVRSLYQVDPAAASRMLDNLVRYLGIALSRMRASESTIGREVALADAFLGVQKTRMGDRLRYSIDVPPDLEDAPLPPMMLLTLVENAIKHGLSPVLEGGAIDIRATERDGLVTIRVADTGRGFAKSLGGGSGLANIRARLSAIFGTGAGLRLALNEPSGVVATIVLPTRPKGAAK